MNWEPCVKQANEGNHNKSRSGILKKINGNKTNKQPSKQNCEPQKVINWGSQTSLQKSTLTGPNLRVQNFT